MKLDVPKACFGKGNDIPSRFRRSVEKHRDQTAFVFKDRRVKWGELGARVNRVANALSSRGVSKGSRVAVLSRNSVEYVEAYFGAISAGACAVPLPTMSSADGLRAILEDAGPAVLFASSEFTQMLNPFIGELPFLVEGGKVGFGFQQEGWLDYEAWIRDVSEEAPQVEIDPKDEFHIIYSSGTTGTPKGIRHDHANRHVIVDGFSPLFSLPGMVNIISTPFYSHTTMVTWLPSMCSGTTTVLMEKFDAREFLRLCEAEKVTIAMLVPVQYDRILQVADFASFDISSMIMKLCTSAPLHPDTKKRILEKMPGEFIEFYGLTEGGVSTVLMTSQFPEKLESVGQAAPGCEIRIIDDKGNEVPAGRTGEIVGRNAVMMGGYHNREQETSETLWLDKEGKAFMRSGDLGRMDEDGFIYLCGRKKEVIISGGFNIFAVDLENELLKHGAVLEAAVIGVPSEKWGETPLAFVVVKKDATETPESLLDWVNVRLGKNQRISRVEFRDELPKSQIGKILKNELKKPYWDK